MYIYNSLICTQFIFLIPLDYLKNIIVVNYQINNLILFIVTIIITAKQK